MFGWFKKTPLPDPSLDDIDLDSWRDPTFPSKTFTAPVFNAPPPPAQQFAPLAPDAEDPYEKILNEFPEFRRYIDLHPNTGQDPCDLLMKYQDAYPVAEREVRRSLLRNGRKLSEDDKLCLIDDRAIELAIEAAMMSDEIEQAEAEGIEQAYQNVIQGNKLDGIRDAIDRSAVAANAIDTMKAHPFLTGFLGAHIIGKIKG